MSTPFLPTEIIKSKRAGREHSKEEISFLVQSFTNGDIPDYQMAAWMMACYFQKLSPKEAAFLTAAMIESGERVDFSHLGDPVCDKHSTGGVGDKASLILGPIAAACGVHVPMVAGRGLAHTGGTLDKLEAIPGFSVNMSLESFRDHVSQHRLSIIGQTAEICPADKKMYALRDVTGTVECLGLIGGSIMSKKIAEGIRGLVLDVKVGSGAFMKTLEEADELARFLATIGAGNGVQVSALITDMSQPLGRFVGNVLEVKECLEILHGQSLIENDRDYFEDTRDLSLALATEMIFLANKAENRNEAHKLAKSALESGAALSEFESMVERQGGDLNALPEAKKHLTVAADSPGYIDQMDTEAIGIATIVLGAGREKSSDSVSPVAGLEVHRKKGDAVQAGEPVFTLYADEQEALESAAVLIKQAFTLSLQPTEKPSLIVKTVT